MDVKNIPDDLLIPWPEMEELPDHPISDGARTEEAAYVDAVMLLEKQTLKSEFPDHSHLGDHTATGDDRNPSRPLLTRDQWTEYTQRMCREFILEKGMIVTGNHIAARAMAQVGPQLAAMVRESTYSEMVLYAFEQLRLLLLPILREHIEHAASGG